MKQHQLFQLLKILSPTEFKQFRKAVQSPLYNTNPSIVLLFDLMRSTYPNFDFKLKDQHKWFRKIFNEEYYDEAKLLRLCSGMCKIVEQYLIYLQLEKDKLSRERLLTNVYDQRHQVEGFRKGIERQHNLLEDFPMQNMNYWAEKMRLHDQLYANVHHDKYDQKDRTPEQLMDAADRFFSFAKVRYGLVLKSKAQIFRNEHPLLFLDALATEHEKGLLQDEPLFKIYYAAMQLMDRPDENNFNAYETLYMQHATLIKGDDQLFLFYMGLNYLARQINSGNSSHYTTALNWNKFALKNKILISNNTMATNIFGNIIIFGCHAKEFDWTWQFIQDYAPFLSEIIRKEEVNYSKAMVYFHQQEFETIIQLLPNYSFSRSYIFKTRNLIIRTYFELFLKNDMYFEQLENNITAYEYYLQRDKTWTSKIKIPHINFCKILKKLAQRKLQGMNRISNLIWLEEELERKAIVTTKNWLLEKA